MDAERVRLSEFFWPNETVGRLLLVVFVGHGSEALP
jgi:hypothetical protein